MSFPVSRRNPFPPGAARVCPRREPKGVRGRLTSVISPPGDSLLLERQNVMINAHKSSASSIATSDAIAINWLKARGVSTAILWDDDGAIVRALLTSGQAAAVLKLLGRRAYGAFRVLPDNLVLIDALVSHSLARRVLAAIRAPA